MAACKSTSGGSDLCRKPRTDRRARIGAAWHRQRWSSIADAQAVTSVASLPATQVRCRHIVGRFGGHFGVNCYRMKRSKDAASEDRDEEQNRRVIADGAYQHSTESGSTGRFCGTRPASCTAGAMGRQRSLEPFGAAGFATSALAPVASKFILSSTQIASRQRKSRFASAHFPANRCREPHSGFDVGAKLRATSVPVPLSSNPSSYQGRDIFNRIVPFEHQRDDRPDDISQSVLEELLPGMHRVKGLCLIL